MQLSGKSHEYSRLIPMTHVPKPASTSNQPPLLHEWHEHRPQSLDLYMTARHSSRHMACPHTARWKRQVTASRLTQQGQARHELIHCHQGLRYNLQRMTPFMLACETRQASTHSVRDIQAYNTYASHTTHSNSRHISTTQYTPVLRAPHTQSKISHHCV